MTRYGNRRNDLQTKVESLPINPLTRVYEHIPFQRRAILEACDQLERAKEFKKQHGPVKIIMKDGVMLP